MNAFKCLVIIISLLFHQVYAEDKLTCDEMKGHVQSVCKKAITGDADAMYDLGLMYDTGEGLPGNKPNYQEAFKWYKKAAEGGDVSAMYNVGVMYYLGEGQPGNKPNSKEAIKWYTKAAGEYEASAGPSKSQNVGT